MNRRQFSFGTLALSAATVFSDPSQAIEFATRQVTIGAKFLTVRQSPESAFGINWDDDFPTYSLSNGKGGITFGESVGDHFENRELFDQIEIDIKGGSPVLAQLVDGFSSAKNLGAPNIDKLMNGASPAGTIRFDGRGLFHDATMTTYDGVSTMIVVRGGQSIVVGGLIRQRKTQTIEKVPVLGNLPVVGEVFKTGEQRNKRYNLLVFVRPNLAGS